METYALVVVTSCWDKTEDVKERMTTRALKDFMGKGSRRERVAVRRSEENVTFTPLLSVAHLAHLLVSHLPKLFPLFCAFLPRQKEDAAKKGTFSRKENPSGSPQ